MPARWKHCVELTDRHYGFALGRSFVRAHFGGDAKEQALSLVHGIQGAMRARLAALPWMDEATRGKALEKLAAIDDKIGYPDAWRGYQGLRVRRDSFTASLADAAAFEVRRQLAKVGRPVDRTEWLMTPPTVNAYYNPAMNEMVFPAGILMPPFYTQGANAAVNHGAIGMVVGHELTHGFDDEGRQYDARGNLADWWSRPVAEEFDRRAACVERQYSEYTAVGDVKVNGRLTLGENLADLGGLALAYQAYQASRAGRPPEAPVAGFTPAQQFFLAHAQAWCQLIREENARLRAVTDPHSPARWRVNGPLSNLPAFAEAFRCQAGSPMVRAERCEVW
jgi:endothelin-converting enzyme/putative endopeptidase